MRRTCQNRFLGFLPGKGARGRCNEIANDGISGCSTAAAVGEPCRSGRTCHLRSAHRHHVFAVAARRFLLPRGLMDRFARDIVGWCVASSMVEPLVLSALRQAIRCR